MTSPRTLLKARGLRAKKSLGQHFLVDAGTAATIVDRAGVAADDTVLEIGAGLGALTLPLAARARRVYAVEIDRRMADLLRGELEAAGAGNVVQLRRDILGLDIADLCRHEHRPLVVVGNLPYHISSQVLVRLIGARQNVSRAVLMFQKELADRIAAPPGSRQYGRLPAMLAYCADVRFIASARAAAFFPVPRVDSAVVEIRFVEKYPCTPEQEAFLFRVIKAAFARRRKTLKNALSGGELKLDASAAQTALQNAGIDPRRRAETVSVAEFLALSRTIAAA